MELPVRLPILFLFTLLIAGCDGRKAGPAAGAAAQQTLPEGGKLDRSQAGKAAPATRFLDPDGAPSTIADFAGKPLLLNLWATWCAPCVAEMPALDSLAARAPNLQVLAVSQDMEGQEAKIATFFEQRKLARLEPYRDSQLGLMTDLGAAVLPTTILYDSKGREVWRITGAADWTGKEAQELLAEGS